MVKQQILTVAFALLVLIAGLSVYFYAHRSAETTVLPPVLMIQKQATSTAPSSGFKGPTGAPSVKGPQGNPPY